MPGPTGRTGPAVRTGRRGVAEPGGAGEPGWTRPPCTARSTAARNSVAACTATVCAPSTASLSGYRGWPGREPEEATTAPPPPRKARARATTAAADEGRHSQPRPGEPGGPRRKGRGRGEPGAGRLRHAGPHPLSGILAGRLQRQRLHRHRRKQQGPQGGRLNRERGQHLFQRLPGSQADEGRVEGLRLSRLLVRQPRAQGQLPVAPVLRHLAVSPRRGPATPIAHGATAFARRRCKERSPECCRAFTAPSVRPSTTATSALDRPAPNLRVMT